MPELLHDLLMHVLISLIVLALFIVAVSSQADPTTYFLRFYGKDVGTVVETLHAANGDVQLNYRNLHPERELIFNFEPDAVRIAPINRTSLIKESESVVDEIHWSVKQRWGVVNEPDRRLDVSGETLFGPQIIDFLKQGSLIVVDGSLIRCAGARQLLPEKDVLLELDAPFWVQESLFPVDFITTLTTNQKPRYRVKLIIEEVPGLTAPIVSVGEGAYRTEALALRCLLSESLVPAFTLPVEEEIMDQNLDYIAIKISLPSSLTINQKTTIKTGIIKALRLYTYE